MVTFSCNKCGSAMKKAQIEGHMRNCRASSVSCVDCSKDFDNKSFKEHVKCISEAEKYSGKSYKASVNKGDIKQEEWLEQCLKAINRNENDKQLKEWLQKLTSYSNIPRKKAKFLNFLSNSLHLRNSEIANKIWEAIIAEAPAKETIQETCTNVNEDVQVAQNSDVVETKKSKEERKTEKLKEDKNDECEDSAKIKKKKKRKEVDEVSEVKKKKKKKTGVSEEETFTNVDKETENGVHDSSEIKKTKKERKAEKLKQDENHECEDSAKIKKKKKKRKEVDEDNEEISEVKKKKKKKKGISEEKINTKGNENLTEAQSDNSDNVELKMTQEERKIEKLKDKAAKKKKRKHKDENSKCLEIKPKKKKKIISED